MSLVLLAFLFGLVAGFYAGLIVARLLQLPPDDETVIMIVSPSLAQRAPDSPRDDTPDGCRRHAPPHSEHSHRRS